MSDGNTPGKSVISDGCSTFHGVINEGDLIGLESINVSQVDFTCINMIPDEANSVQKV